MAISMRFPRLVILLPLALLGFSQPAAAFFWKKKKPVEVAAAPTAVAPAESTAQLTAQAQAAYQRGELKKAGKLFTRAQKQDRKDPALTFNAGIFYFQVQNHDRAERYLNETLALNPDHALAFFYLGLMAEQDGDQNRALDFYSESARRDKRVLDARYNKEIVRSKLVMDVRLRRYLEGDRPLDFAPVATPPPLPVAEKAPAKPEPAPEVKPAPKPEPKPEPKPAPPAPEIRIETKPDTPSDKLPPTAKPAAKPAPVRPAPPPPPSRTEPEEEQEREAPAPPPLPPGPVTELPDIDRED